MPRANHRQYVMPSSIATREPYHAGASGGPKAGHEKARFGKGSRCYHAPFNHWTSAMAYRNLEISHRDAVRSITVNRPDKLNALNRETLNELTLAFIQAAQDDAVRVVVLAGAGHKALAAGAEISE